MSARQLSTQVGPFAMVPRWVIVALRGQPWSLSLYSILADHADRESDEWRIGRKALADEMGCGLSTFQAALAVLVEQGCVEVIPTANAQGDQGWNRYRVMQLAPGGSVAIATGVGSPGNRGRLTEQPGSVGPSTAKGDNHLPEPQTKTPPPSLPLGAPSDDGAACVDNEAFDRFWALYRQVPHGAGKADTKARWARALRGAKVSAAVVETGLARWVAYWKLPGATKVQWPQGWLTARRWEADPPPAVGPVGRAAPESADDKFARLEAEMGA